MELKGQKACMGIIKGKAFVIAADYIERVNQFPEGHILVTYKTTPEFTHIFSKAAAIVTQMGGILSHAAIVSREYKVPCIVGVPNLLMHIKDGEEITVDANTGTVITYRDITTQLELQLESPKISKLIQVTSEPKYCTWCGEIGHTKEECEDCTYCEMCDGFVDHSHQHMHCDYCNTEMEHDTDSCPNSQWCEWCDERVDIDHEHPYCEYCESHDHSEAECENSTWCEDCDMRVELEHEHQFAAA